MVVQQTIEIRTPGRSSIEISGDIDDLVRQSGIQQGLCNIFILHTSASLMLCENADPAVRADLERFMGRLAPDGDPMFAHTTEGLDDMAAHVRSILTDSHLNLPVDNGRCVLGAWQGIYLWEHRQHPHTRKIMVTIYGDA
ncbi:MAG: secondary thiamine-phosphate synthase enzyme YjbQ [Gammaproteobacteria bacterium]